ncbi:MAG TPA: DUF6567 family protein [Stellaceae bacterium]|nr:DUF6567 family protein [Stellaceae bacterium]
MTVRPAGAILASALWALSLCACTSSGRLNESSGTSVQLSHDNYEVLKAGATGSSSGFWFLFIPIASPNYAAAKADLYRSVNEPLNGKPIALANETDDHSFFTLLLFSIPTIKVTADVVEFTDQPALVPGPATSEGGSANTEIPRR